MLTKKKIIFIVDVKNRDLTSLTKMAKNLRNLKYKSIFLPGSIANPRGMEIIFEINPVAIVIPKANFNRNLLSKCRIKGIKIIVVETEGNNQDKNFKYRISIEPDLYIFWNHSHSKKYKFLSCEKEILGFHRGDMLWDIKEKKLLKKRNSIEKNRVVTIATAALDANFTPEQQKIKSKRRKRSCINSGDYFKIIRTYEEQRDLIKDFLFWESKKNNDYKIVLKPHPRGNFIYWENIINKINSERISIMNNQPINSLLIDSDLHISFSACTTTIEALLLGIKTIELESSLSYELFDKAHISMANYKAKSSLDLSQKINKSLKTLEKYNVPIHKFDNKLNEYISKYFYKFDGKRCNEYAKKIDQFLSCENKNYSIRNNIILNLIAYYHLIITSFKINILRLASNFIPYYKNKLIYIEGKNKTEDYSIERFEI